MVKIGPTGEYPCGKMVDDDEGELQLAIGVMNGKVVMEFGAPVGWLGMEPDTARRMGEALIEKAEKAELQVS